MMLHEVPQLRQKYSSPTMIEVCALTHSLANNRSNALPDNAQLYMREALDGNNDFAACPILKVQTNAQIAQRKFFQQATDLVLRVFYYPEMIS